MRTRNAYGVASDLLASALASLEQDPEATLEDRYRLLMERTDTHRWQGDWISLLDTAMAAIEVAEQLDDVRRLADAASSMTIGALWQSPAHGADHPVVIAALRRALDELPPGEDERRCRAMVALAAEAYYKSPPVRAGGAGGRGPRPGEAHRRRRPAAPRHAHRLRGDVATGHRGAAAGPRAGGQRPGGRAGGRAEPRDRADAHRGRARGAGPGRPDVAGVPPRPRGGRAAAPELPPARPARAPHPVARPGGEVRGRRDAPGGHPAPPPRAADRPDRARRAGRTGVDLHVERPQRGGGRADGPGRGRVAAHGGLGRRHARPGGTAPSRRAPMRPVASWTSTRTTGTR